MPVSEWALLFWSLWLCGIGKTKRFTPFQVEITCQMTIDRISIKSFLFVWIVMMASRPAFSQLIPSNVYGYNPESGINHTNYEERTLAEGSTRDFSHVIVQVFTLPANKPSLPVQQFDEEAVVVVKEGELTVTLGGKRKTLSPGGMVLLMPGDDFQIDNKAAQPLTYYQMRYTSNEMPDLDVYRLLGGSFWLDRQELTANQTTYGTVMSSRVTMQITTIDAQAAAQAPHTHRAAELVIVLDHPVQAHVAGQYKEAQPGDVIFIESETPHSIRARGQRGSTCFTFQF